MIHPHRHLSPFLRALFFWFLFVFLENLFFRGSFWTIHNSILSSISLSDLIHGMAIGLRFDLRVALLLTTPPLVLGAIFGLPGKKPALRIFWGILLGIFATVQAVFWLAQLGIFSYLQTSVAASHLELLSNWKIALQMVWESYPVVPGLGLLLAFSFLIYIYWKRFFPAVLEIQWFKWKSNTRGALIWIFVILFWAGGLYGKFAHYPLRWSEAFFSAHQKMGHFVVNPLHHFVDTLNFRRPHFDEKLLKKYWPALAHYLGIDEQDYIGPNQFVRSYPPNPQVQMSPLSNVVVIVMESLAYYKTGLSGNPFPSTPFIDSLAKNGMLFSEFFVPTQATARSIFALVTGVPDMSQKKSGSRNPFLVEQSTVMTDFRDHEKFYFLGGSANWGNIRGIFSRNISGIKIFEEGSYPEYPRVDVWGISDYHLFEKAHKVFEARSDQKPFFAVIQSSGFHRPYTIPEVVPNFSIESHGKKEMSAAGFSSIEEYNAMRLQDFSLAHFFHLAEKSDYFSNTLFVIFGDHGLPHGYVGHYSKGYQEFSLGNFHVPLIFYAPEKIKKSVEERIAWQPDILPTIAGLLGVPYTTRSLGRDLLAKDREGEEGAFMFSWYKTPEEFLYLGKEYLYKGAPGKPGALFSYKGPTPEKEIQDQKPKIFQKFQQTAKGLYYGSQYLMYHNRKSEPSQ